MLLLLLIVVIIVVIVVIVMVLLIVVFIVVMAVIVVIVVIVAIMDCFCRERHVLLRSLQHRGASAEAALCGEALAGGPWRYRTVQWG